MTHELQTVLYLTLGQSALAERHELPAVIHYTEVDGTICINAIVVNGAPLPAALVWHFQSDPKVIDDCRTAIVRRQDEPTPVWEARLHLARMKREDPERYAALQEEWK